MKNILILLIFSFFLLPCTVHANDLFANDSSVKPIGRGDILLEAGIGGGYIINGADETDVKRGFLTADLRFLYALNSRFYIGVEGLFEHGKMAGNEVPYGPQYESPFARIESRDNYYNSWGALLAARFNFNPDSSWRVYLPFAAGYMQRKQTTEYKVYPTGVIPPYFEDLNYEFTKKRNYGEGIAGYVGLGLEHDFKSRILLGAEARYTFFRCGGQTVGNIALLAKFGFRV